MIPFVSKRENKRIYRNSVQTFAALMMMMHKSFCVLIRFHFHIQYFFFDNSTTLRAENRVKS